MRWNQDKKQFRIGEFLLFAGFFAGIRQILVSSLPIYAITTAGADDGLMVRGAWAMIRYGVRGWLGFYDSVTLVKGFFFPAFLAAANRLGISYISAAALLYAAACVLFILAVSRLFKTKYPLYVSYLLLLFNPAATSGDVLQRVYRNSITPAQVLFIFGGFFAMYLRRKEGAKKMLPWALLAGLGWASLEHSREDTIWILPAAALITVISLAAFFLDGRREGRRRRVMGAGAVVLLLPAFLFWASHPAVSVMNQVKYGIYTYNELNDSRFGDAMRAIYSVRMEGEDIPYVSASRAKLRQLYEVSDSLASIEDSLEKNMDEWSTVDRNKEDNEVEDGWFFWVLRKAAADEGYYETAQKANSFFGHMADEIEAALEDGRLERQPVMPSALMPPWREGRFGAVMQALGEAACFMTSYELTEPFLYESVAGVPGDIGLFETVTGNRALYPEEERGSQPDWQAYSQTLTEQRVSRLVFISGLYKKTGAVAAVSGLAAWLLLTVSVLRDGAAAWKKLFQKRGTEVLPSKDSGEQEKERDGRLSLWLVLSALLGGLLCLMGGVAYNHAASCPSINNMYLCGAYPLMLAAWTLADGYFLELWLIRAMKARSGAEERTEKK